MSGDESREHLTWWSYFSEERTESTGHGRVLSGEREHRTADMVKFCLGRDNREHLTW